MLFSCGDPVFQRRPLLKSLPCPPPNCPDAFVRNQCEDLFQCSLISYINLLVCSHTPPHMESAKGSKAAGFCGHPCADKIALLTYRDGERSVLASCMKTSYFYCFYKKLWQLSRVNMLNLLSALVSCQNPDLVIFNFFFF